MKRIELEIKALSPLAIAKQKPGGSISESEDYIPGSVIRGAIASQILQQSGHQSNDLTENGGDFQALFLSDEPAIFQNAYPATLDIQGKIVPQDRVEEIKVLPSTALSSKTKPGFKPKNSGVFDTLIDRFFAEAYKHPYDPTCPQEQDGGRVEPYSCFYSKYNGKYHSLSANKRLLTRVGINRRRATSEEEILYSIQVLNESASSGKNPKPVIYKGAILIPDNFAESFQQFIHSNRENFRLGGSTSRGLGKVEINVKKAVDMQLNLKDKITVFNQKLQDRYKRWQIFGKPVKEDYENRTYFSIDLQADAILTEQWQRTTVISVGMLQEFAGVEDKSLKLEAAYSSYDYRSGWNAAWGLMKDIELITNKGGVYLFSTTEPDKWYEALAELELKGVGARTSEGFGQIEVCNEFHLVLREEAV